jgi:SAM-dependent methyltransferase
MRSDFLGTLHCPYSGSKFTRSSVVKGTDSDIDYGVVTSEAGDFPILEGILRLRVDEYRSPLLAFIKNRQYEKALLTALEIPSYGRGWAAVNFLDRLANTNGLAVVARVLRALKGPAYRAMADATETFSGTANRLKSKSWADWHIYRFSMPAFLPVYPLLHLVEVNGPLLDFGCGVGHAAFLFSRRIPGSHITCVDYQFSLLYLAKRFFVPDANFLALDGDYLLPFASSYFSSVVSSDVLHLIDSKVSLSREFQRIVSEKGAIILPHLHNKSSPIQFAKPLTAEAYGALFHGSEKRIIPEDRMVEEFIRNDSLDLERQWTGHELHDAIKGLSIIVSQDTSLFRRYSGLWDKHVDCMTSPIVNPLYRISGSAGRWTLRKEDPDASGKLIPKGVPCLPDTVSLDLPSLDRNALLGLKTSNRSTFAELVRKLVLVEVPEGFR